MLCKLHGRGETALERLGRGLLATACSMSRPWEFTSLRICG